jgi:mono/diheme cytochrome c family protein
MKRLLVWIIVLLSTWSCGAAAVGNAKNGAALYADACASCHGEDGLGMDGSDSSMNGVNLRNRVEELSNRALARAVLEGVGEMEPLAMTEAEVEDVIAFLRTESWRD